MDSFEARRGRRASARRRLKLSTIERLETRAVMEYTPLGSLQNLALSGYAAPVLAWGGPLAVTVDVHNLGIATIPNAQAELAGNAAQPNNPGPAQNTSADAGPATVGVYLSPRPHIGRGSVKIGDISVASVAQNSVVETSAVFQLPARPPGFLNGRAWVELRVDSQTGPDASTADKTTPVGIPVQITVPLPEAVALSMDTPPVMQPGDTIAPAIKIANFGTIDTAPQGPFDVLLVASTDRNFGPGDTVLAQFTVSSIPPLSAVPSSNTVLGDVNITNPTNVLTLQSPNITLPVTAHPYFIGVIVDPQHRIRQIQQVGRAPSFALSPVAEVAPVPGLTPAGVIATAPPAGNVFPIPAYGVLASALHPENGGQNPFVPGATTVASAIARASAKAKAAAQSNGSTPVAPQFPIRPAGL